MNTSLRGILSNKYLFNPFACVNGIIDRTWLMGLRRGCCVPPKKGGRKRAVSAQCEVRLKMATAGLRQISRSCAWWLSRIKKIVFFFQTWRQKVLENAENAQKKKRPEVAWWKTQQATRSRLVYCDDAEGDWASRCRRSENTSRRLAKNFNRFESHTQHLSNEAKVIASSPICKRSVIDLVDLVMSRDHQNDNAVTVWLCPVTKKKWSKKRIWSRAHLNRQPLAPKSAVYHLSYLGIDECTRKKIHWIMQVTATECSILGQEKKVWCAWINLNKAKVSLFRLSNNLCCRWCWSLRFRSYPNPLINGKSYSKSLTRIA